MADRDLVQNRVPVKVREALRRGKARLLYEVDHPDGYVRACSGPSKIRFDGYDWLATGSLVDIEGVGGDRKTFVQVVTATLAGLTAADLKFVNKNVRGRVARFSLCALRPGTRVVDGPVFPFCVGRCDSQDSPIEAGARATIVLKINKALFIAGRTPKWAWTPEWLRDVYGDVSGLDDLPGSAPRTLSWTKT